MSLDKLSREDMILGGVAVLLLIDLLFLPWFSISLGGLGSIDVTATDDPDGLLGVLAVLVDVVLIADLAVERFSSQTQLPAINNSRTYTRFIEACVVALLVLVKFLVNIHFSDFGFGFWLAVVLTVALVYFARQMSTSGLGVTGRL